MPDPQAGSNWPRQGSGPGSGGATLAGMAATVDERLAQVFVELADTLVAGFDLMEFLQTLTERCVELLEVDAAGLLLADSQGALRLVAASTEQARVAELFQIQNDEGPCLDCYRTGQVVIDQRHRCGAGSGAVAAVCRCRARRWALRGCTRSRCGCGIRSSGR